MGRVRMFVLCLVCCGLGLTFGGLRGASAEFKLRMAGRIESNLFLGLAPPNKQGQKVTDSNLGQFFDYRNSNSLFLQLRPKLGRLTGRAELQVRNINFSRATNAVDLELYEQQFPVSMRLYEVYIDFNELLPFMDLRVGQQRIAWGTATAFNPTDNINPYNLENPLDFTERLPVTAIKATFYLFNSETASGQPLSMNFTLVATPFFVPSVIPFTLFKEVVNVEGLDSLLPAADWTYTSKEKIQRPAYRIEDGNVAAKLAAELGPVNLSASYFFGRSLFPAQNNANTTNIDLKEKNVTVDVNLVYPRIHVIGLDLSASLGGVGVWIEASLTIPHETVDLLITLNGEKLEKNPLTGVTIPTVPVIKADPYVKVTAGLDYTFPGGWYFNWQYLYGFFNQQNADELHHYTFLTLRKGFFRGKLMIQLTGAYELDLTKKSGPNFDGKEPGMAFLVNPEIQFSPFDSAKLILGGVLTRGHKNTTLYLFQQLAQVYFRAKMSF